MTANASGPVISHIRLLSDIDDAMRANNMHNDPAFRQDLCRCDPSVGMCPCAYCVIHDTLRRCKLFVEANAGGQPRLAQEQP